MYKNLKNCFLIPVFSESYDEKLWNIKINCLNCSNFHLNNCSHLFNSKCRICLINCLIKYQNKTISTIFDHQNHKIIEDEYISYFLDYIKYFKHLNKIFKKIQKLVHRDRKKFRYFELELDFDINLRKIDPFFLYEKLRKQLKLNLKKNSHDLSFQKWFYELNENIKKILLLLDSLNLIKNLISTQKTFDLNHSREKFTEKAKTQCKLFNCENLIENKILIKTYFIGSSKYFQISIYNWKYHTEKLYRVEIFFENPNKSDYYKEIINKISSYLKSLKIDKILTFQELVDLLLKHSLIYLNEIMPNLSTSEKHKLSFFSSINILNIKKLLPLLIDDYIEEIFLDQPNDKIYLNHQIYGRCRTEISLDLEEIERIKTFLRLYSRERLDINHPSVKTVIKNNYFYCRFSIDIFPLQLNGFCLDIRKLNKNIFSIPDLIFYQTLSSEIASFLYFCIIKRINLTVTGETDTGKTTLINAFDLLTPKEFRKIYVENAVESLDELKFDMHQVKYKTQSLENTENSQFTKSNLIQTLLHRTPDVIFLGEILTMEECKALFHCLSAGLRGFQTIHSKDISALINRFLYHFKIEKICLNDLDLIILMKKLPIGRKIVAIIEISVNNRISVEKIFDYNPMTNNWMRKKNLYHTNILKKIIKYEHLPEEDFNLIINLFKEIFDFLSKFRSNKISDLVSIFNVIGFLASKNNYLELIQFWEKIKKNLKKGDFKFKNYNKNML